MTKILMTSDLHLTDRFRDEYRWEVFRRLHSVAKANGVEAIAILGDLTDAKDGHSARMVTRMAEEISSLAKRFEVLILKGNHDYTEEDTPFFGFLDLLPNVRFVSNPEKVTLIDVPILALPHAHPTEFNGDNGSKNSLLGAKVGGLVTSGGYELLFLHQTIRGSMMSNGQEIQGTSALDIVPLKNASVSRKPLRHFEWYRSLPVPIIAGDVHVPQRIGNLTYIGSPHPVAFGDEWRPRFLLYNSEDKKVTEVALASIQKLSLKMIGPEGCESLPEKVGAGDQLKVKVFLKRDDLHRWSKLRHDIFRLVAKAGAALEMLSVECVDSNFLPSVEDNDRSAVLSLSDAEIMKQYCDENMVSAALTKAGLGLLTE